MVHSFLFGSIWSYSVHSVLCSPLCPLKFYSVQFGPFGLISVHFGLIRSISYTLALFGLHWPYVVLFGLLRSMQSTLVLFSPFCPLQSYLGHSIHFGLIQSILSTLVRSYERPGNLTLKKRDLGIF